jgi:hypothetical protein
MGITEVQENGQGRPEVVASANGADQLDRAGQEILGLLQRAAGIAEKNSQHALGIAHKLSLELRAAEDHIKKLESELQYYKDRSSRAEEWLRQISAQIEFQFPARAEAAADREPPRQNGEPQRLNGEPPGQDGPEAYAPKKSDRRRT